jgi:hypothetical protein
VDDATGAPPPGRSRLTHLTSPTTLWAALAAFPLVLAIVLLTRRPWAPVLDMAMTELRLRDVGGGHTPLIGLPGRIGNFPDQGSHPGPASFYLLAPFYRIGGSSAWGMELGSVAINVAAVALVVWIGYRVAGRTGAVVFAAVAAVAVRGYGMTVLTHPWNPYFPVLLWLLALVAAWAVLTGDHWMAVVTVVTASIAAQTHVPYLVSAIAICVLVLGWLGYRRALRPLAVTAGVGAVLLVPPLIDQLIRDPGNIRMLIRHFASEPPEPAIGTGDAVRLFFRHLDAPSVAIDLATHGDAFVHRSGLPGGNCLLGLGVFLVWLACAFLARRRGYTTINALNGVAAVALAAGAFSMLRIFGKVWYYLTLWAWSSLLLVVLSVLWTGWLECRRRDVRLPVSLPRATAAAALVVCTAMSIGAAITHEVPEHQLSDGLRAVIPATVAALDAGDGPAVGHDGRYLVFWQDSVFIGAQGYGLVNELERRGFEVGVHETWRVPVTPQRVFPEGTYDAEVHLVSGAYIDEWRERPGYVEVVDFDVRSDAERQRFEQLRTDVIARFGELGRADLVPEIDINLFGASLDADLPDDVVADLAEMLLLAEPIAIFLAPPGSTS